MIMAFTGFRAFFICPSHFCYYGHFCIGDLVVVAHEFSEVVVEFEFLFSCYDRGLYGWFPTLSYQY